MFIITGCRQERIELMDFDVERDFELVTELIKEAADIGEVIEIEEALRLRRGVALNVTVESGNIYEVSIALNDEDSHYVQTITSEDAKWGDRGNVYRFDQRSVDVIQEATGFNRSPIVSLLHTLRTLNIGEIIRAELLETAPDSVFTEFEIECEDNNIYHIRTVLGYIRITDVATGKIIYEIHPSPIGFPVRESDDD